MERLTRHQTVLYQRHQRQRIHDLFWTKHLHGIRDVGNTHPTPWVPSAQKHEIPPVRTCWAIAPLTILSGFETTCSAKIVLKHIKHIKPSVKACSPCSFVPCRFCPLDLFLCAPWWKAAEHLGVLRGLPTLESCVKSSHRKM